MIMTTLLAIVGAWVGLAVICYGTWARFGRRLDESMVHVLVEHGHRLPGAAGSGEREVAARRLIERANLLWAVLTPGVTLLMMWLLIR